MEVGDAHVFDEIGVIGMIVDDTHDVGRQFTGPPPREQVEEAMGLFARHESDSWTDIGEAKVDRHVEPGGDRREGPKDLVSFDTETVEFELDSLEEDALHLVGVLFGVHDVAVVRRDEVGDRRHDTALVGTRQEEDSGTGHPGSLLDRLRFRTLPRANETVTMDDGEAWNVEQDPTTPLVIRSAGTLLDEVGDVYPVVRLDANGRPELAGLVDTVAELGVGDLTTFADLRLGDGGRRFVRLVSSMTSPVEAQWCVDFALPGFEDLLRLAAETGGIVVSFLVDGDDGDRWLGVNLDADALLPLLN